MTSTETTTETKFVNDDDTQQFQQIIRDRTYEHEDIQKKAFTKWINNQLETTSSTPPVNDLFQDLRDGVVLLRLLEVLTGNEYKRENGKMRVHHIGNVNKVIGVLQEYGIKLLNISSNDIVDGNPKLTLGLIWAIIQYWQGKEVRESASAPESQQNNIEKFLLSWCQQQTKGYANVQIEDFTRSWQSGLAFNALIHRFHSNLFDYEDLIGQSAEKNLEHAFSVAQNVFKIDRYLDVEDILAEYPDKKSIIMYVMCLFQQLPNTRIVIEEKEKNQRSISPKEETETTMNKNEVTTFQLNMQNILQWIIQLEQQLDEQEPVATDDLKKIKENFQQHEEFMIRLTRDQNQIGDVLQQGNRILTSKTIRLESTEESSIKEQMKHLNKQWESLRSKSLQRQSILHKTLMKLQIDQIDSFDQWLTQTEEQITKNLETMETNLTGVDRQYQELAQLQDELVAQQQITESLQNMVIVVDDSSSESEESSPKYSSTRIESKLLDLSERWAQICNFVQTRWIQLQEVKIEFEQIDANCKKIDRWLTEQEEHLQDSFDTQPQTIRKIRSEMDEIRESILSLDNSLKVLSGYFDRENSLELKSIDDQLNQFEKRWKILLVNVENLSLQEAQPKEENGATQNDSASTTLSTTFDETSTSYDKAEQPKKPIERQTTPTSLTMKSDFDLSARKYLDWIDSIERILNEKSSLNVSLKDRQEIIEEVKAKYASYDEQFQHLLQTGRYLIEQIPDANDLAEHQTVMKTLEHRWKELYQQIEQYEHDIDRSIVDEDLNELTQLHENYQVWFNRLSPSTSINDLQVKFDEIQSLSERLTNLKRMSSRLDTSTQERINGLIRSWDESQTRLGERIIPVQYTTESSGMAATGVSSAPTSPNRDERSYVSSTATTTTTTATTATNLGPSIGENGSLFTLTNIYTFGGGDGNSLEQSAQRYVNPTDLNDDAYEQRYRETHSSSMITRKVRTSATESYDYDSSAREGTMMTGRYPSTTMTSYSSQLSSTFTDTQRKLRLWLEHVEKSINNDKLRLLDLNAINAKRRHYKDFLDQANEHERNLESLREQAREFYTKLSVEHNRQLRDDLLDYHNRLQDVKMFLSNSLTKCHRFEKTLTDFQRSVEEVHRWIQTTQTKITITEGSHGNSRLIENQLDRNQALQREIHEMQTILNRLNHDIVELTQNADENLARHLRDEMKSLNESWSHMISSTKISSHNLQEALKRTKLFEEEIRDLEDWINEKEREVALEDGAVFYQEQLRDRYDHFQRLQNELNIRETSVRALVDQLRQDSNQPSQQIDHLVSIWSSLQKKIDVKVTFYTDALRMHDELRELLQRENIWLDQLQTKIFNSSSHGADAEEISEELDGLERFLKSHSKTNHERIFELVERLQMQKVSLSTTSSQITQYQTRWNQLQDEALKRIHTLNSQINDYQQLGHQITGMFEWMKHTENTLNARLRDNVYANDVPSETENLTEDFNRYEIFLQTVEDKIQTLRSLGKGDAARRLEQQYIHLKNQFTQLQEKFRFFQRPSDFEPKFKQLRQIIQDVEQKVPLLEIRSDDPDILHDQSEQCLRIYKTLADIKSEVEYVIRTGRSIVVKQQTAESIELNRQLDQLKNTYNNLGDRISAKRKQLDNIERHLRKFRKEYSLIHEWFVQNENELRKIENKQVSKNTREEIDWIRTTRSYIRKLDANFETLRNTETTIHRDLGRPLPSLHERINELKRQVDLLDRRLRDRSEIVDGQVRKLDEEYRRFEYIYRDILVRLEKLESLLYDSERVLDVTRLSQVQEELRSVRTQLDEVLNLGHELVSKSEKYSKLVGPDIENISRKFTEIQNRIRIIQETQEKRLREQHTTTIHINREQPTTTTTSSSATTTAQDQNDQRQEFYSERRYHRTERETRHRSPSENSERISEHGIIDEEFKKKYLRCLAYMKLIERLYDRQYDTDEDETEHIQRRRSRRDRGIRDRPEYEEIERIIRETEERALIIERTDVVQAQRIREKIRQLKECLESLRLRSDQHEGGDETFHFREQFSERIQRTDRTVPQREQRDFDSDFIFDIDDTRSVISEPSPFYNTKYRKTVHSMERYRHDDQLRQVPTQEEYQLQPLLRVRSLKAIDHRTLSAPSSPVLQPRYRSYERSNIQYTKQSTNQQGQQNNYQNSISKSASMPNGGFPVQNTLFPYPPPPPPQFYPAAAQGMRYRERVIDKHVAERSTSRGESHREQRQQSATQQHARSASASGNQNQSYQLSIPVRFEESSSRNAGGASGVTHTTMSTESGGFQTSSANQYYHDQQQNNGGAYRQQSYDQQMYTGQPVGRHPTRIVN